jgi:uncharacterized protein YukE
MKRTVVKTEIRTKEYVEEAQKETDEIMKEIDSVIDKYLGKSKMPLPQKYVNIGRALNAYHIAWIGHISATLEKVNEAFS